ncbi:MAG TPA: hypothetical protein VFT43_11240 [Candidatus Polarisedimenticolia bacterium]|nr:hypothetical protein [Candidatus Polarisedimenticolia bacterium]
MRSVAALPLGVLLAGGLLLAGCFGAKGGALQEEASGTPYSFPRSSLAVIHPDAVLFYSLDTSEFDDLPESEREGLKEALPDFYARIIKLERTLRQRGITVERSAATLFRFEDETSGVQVYERRLHQGGTGMILFGRGKTIAVYPGILTEEAILAAVDDYFSGRPRTPPPESEE